MDLFVENNSHHSTCFFQILYILSIKRFSNVLNVSIDIFFNVLYIWSSLAAVKTGCSLFYVIARQVKKLRRKTNCRYKLPDPDSERGNFRRLFKVSSGQPTDLIGSTQVKNLTGCFSIYNLLQVCFVRNSKNKDNCNGQL